jgi:hypothetical protein
MNRIEHSTFVGARSNKNIPTMNVMCLAMMPCSNLLKVVGDKSRANNI